MKKLLKTIPKFKSEKEEREFWQKVDSTEYVAYDNLQNWHFPNLKFSTKPITIRLPISVIDNAKIKAHKMDIPYQSLLKKIIYDGLSS